MIINSVAHYVPEKVVPNEYFLEINGLSDEFIVQRTGIKTRRVTGSGENTNTMAIEAVKASLDSLPFPIQEVDLIIGATYSPYDTVGTLAHAIQQKFDIDKAIVVSISAACSSFVNAVEIAEGYFSTGKAKKAIIVASEHNTYYNNEDNIYSGHLWGDGSAALFLSKEKYSDQDVTILDISTSGLANIDKGPDGVFLRPKDGGILMPDGKNVFLNACKYMAQSTEDILHKNGYTIKDLSYFIAHQANKRITDNVANRLMLNPDQVFTNIEEFGNTGCASSAIAFSQNYHRLKKDDIIVLSVFGGGYSCGSILMKK